MSRLGQKLTLHDVADVEAFCRSVMNEHFAVGAKTKNGYTGAAQLRSPHDFDVCLGDLISHAWNLASKFNGNGRFSGFLVQRLHWAITDWKRTYYRSTRYGGPTEELTDDERDLIATIVDFTGPEVHDLVRLIEEPHRTTLERIVIPVVFGIKTLEDYSSESGISMTDIDARVRRLGRHLEQRQLLAA